MIALRDVLRTLAERYAFGEVAALVRVGARRGTVPVAQAARLQQLCAFGDGLLYLNAPDPHGDPLAGVSTDVSLARRAPLDAVPDELIRRAAEARMPARPDDPHRGPLGSLLPTYQLLLETLAVRLSRTETLIALAGLHLSSEYLPLLIWQRVLGHAADPARLAGYVMAVGSAWGDPDDPDCPHSNAEKAAARQMLRVAGGSTRGWRDYLDRKHSLIARALAACGGSCPRPCQVFTQLPETEQRRVEDACRTATAFEESPLVALRHHSPAGHGFGVPTMRDVRTSWAQTRRLLGRTEPAVLVDDGYPLPGLPSLFSALAGTPVRPGTLLAETAGLLSVELIGAG